MQIQACSHTPPASFVLFFSTAHSYQPSWTNTKIHVTTLRTSRHRGHHRESDKPGAATWAIRASENTDRLPISRALFVFALPVTLQSDNSHLHRYPSLHGQPLPKSIGDGSAEQSAAAGFFRPAFPHTHDKAAASCVRTMIHTCAVVQT